MKACCIQPTIGGMQSPRTCHPKPQFGEAQCRPLRLRGSQRTPQIAPGRQGADMQGVAPSSAARARGMRIPFSSDLETRSRWGNQMCWKSQNWKAAVPTNLARNCKRQLAPGLPCGRLALQLLTEPDRSRTSTRQLRSGIQK